MLPTQWTSILTINPVTLLRICFSNVLLYHWMIVTNNDLNRWTAGIHSCFLRPQLSLLIVRHSLASNISLYTMTSPRTVWLAKAIHRFTILSHLTEASDVSTCVYYFRSSAESNLPYQTKSFKWNKCLEIHLRRCVTWFRLDLHSVSHIACTWRTCCGASTGCRRLPNIFKSLCPQRRWQLLKHHCQKFLKTKWSFFFFVFA